MRDYDDVNGVIIGPDLLVGALYYQGRPQTGQLYAESDDALLVLAKGEKDRIRLECGAAFPLIFPEDSWELRIRRD